MHFKIGPLWEKNRINVGEDMRCRLSHDIVLITVIAWRYLFLGASAKSPCFNYSIESYDMSTVAQLLALRSILAFEIM